MIRIDRVDVTGHIAQRSWCTLADFIADNCEDDEMCDRVLKLKVGESFRWGGGAAPLWKITRTSES